MTDLLPCPFCGTKAELLSDDFGAEYACCMHCSTSTALYYVDGQAVKAWNTRATTAGESK